jgi:hypothetical protein
MFKKNAAANKIYTLATMTVWAILPCVNVWLDDSVPVTLMGATHREVECFNRSQARAFGSRFLRCTHVVGVDVTNLCPVLAL